MDTSTIFNNETFLITITTQTSFKKNPFDSWYIGGIIFMLTVIMMLLCVNFYRENSFQILWTQLLVTLHITQSSSQAVPSSSNSINNTFSS